MLKTLAIGSLLLISGSALAAELSIESGKWHLLSMPGNAPGPVSTLFGDTLTADIINTSWGVFTYNSASSAYKQLGPEDRIDSSDAFWLGQFTGEAITIDLSLAVDQSSLQSSPGCVSVSGCVEHELNASDGVSWTLIGSPFSQSVDVNDLRLITTSGRCTQGCTMARAIEEDLTNGIFYRYDANTLRYTIVSEGDSLQPGSGYWFASTLPADTEGAKLLIPSPSPEPANANLLFRSGFEQGTTLSPTVYGYQRLTGTDLVSGFAWDESLNGLWGSSNNGIHLIDGGGIPGGIQNELQTVVGPTGEDTMALYQNIEFSSGAPTAQTPYQINNIDDDPDEYYISYWIKIDDTSLSEPGKWRIIWQYKTDDFHYHDEDEPVDMPGYRIGVYIYTDDEGAYWHVKGDDQNPDYWSVSERNIPVPRNEWFQVEVYSKVSAGDDGRFWARINGNEIASHDGPNLGSDVDSMYFMMLWQLYGNSYPGHQWIDDVEIWDGYPY